jgi:hypothetical protein
VAGVPSLRPARRHSTAHWHSAQAAQAQLCCAVLWLCGAGRPGVRPPLPLPALPLLLYWPQAAASYRAGFWRLGQPFRIPLWPLILIEDAGSPDLRSTVCMRMQPCIAARPARRRPGCTPVLRDGAELLGLCACCRIAQPRPAPPASAHLISSVLPAAQHPSCPRPAGRARSTRARRGRPWLLQGRIYGGELQQLSSCCRIAQPCPAPACLSTPHFLCTARCTAPQLPPPSW